MLIPAAKRRKKRSVLYLCSNYITPATTVISELDMVGHHLLDLTDFSATIWHCWWLINLHPLKTFKTKNCHAAYRRTEVPHSIRLVKRKLHSDCFFFIPAISTDDASWNPWANKIKIKRALTTLNKPFSNETDVLIYMYFDISTKNNFAYCSNIQDKQK